MASNSDNKVTSQASNLTTLARELDLRIVHMIPGLTFHWANRSAIVIFGAPGLGLGSVFEGTPAQLVWREIGVCSLGGPDLGVGQQHELRKANCFPLVPSHIGKPVFLPPCFLLHLSDFLSWESARQQVLKFTSLWML